MKKIEAIVLETRVSDIKQGLTDAGLDYGVILSCIEGRGTVSPKAKRGPRLWGGRVYTSVLMPKVKLELFVEDRDVDPVIDVIRQQAGERPRGKDPGSWESLRETRISGKIFVSDVIQAVAIRTGEKGEKALRSSEYTGGAGA